MPARRNRQRGRQTHPDCFRRAVPGPRSREQLRDVTPAEALAHPTWDMGLMVTTNSASLVNKGLEVIEAHLLFDVPLDRIDVVVHPQSVVHSMVQFVDGSIIAQASPPDMRLPIALGLGWPDRVPRAATALRLEPGHQLDVRAPGCGSLPRRGTGQGRGEAGEHLSGRLQRCQRGSGGSLPRRAGSASPTSWTPWSPSSANIQDPRS